MLSFSFYIVSCVFSWVKLSISHFYYYWYQKYLLLLIREKMGDKNKTTCNVCLSTAALTTWSLATLQLLSMVYPLTNLSPATPLTPPTLLIVFECVHMLECDMCAGRSWRKPDLPPSSLQQRETFLFNEV